MESYSVFVPQLLPRSEPFAPGLRSCPGCGQAAAARIIAKALSLHRRGPYGEPRVRIETSMLPYERWQEFGETRGQKTKRSADRFQGVLAIAADAGTFGDMLPQLAAARSQGRRLLSICFMNEAGIERGAAEAEHAGCAPDHVKPLSSRFAGMHGLIRRMQDAGPDFLATACPSYPFDLVEKIGLALACPGVSVLAVLVPCPTGCLYDAALSAQSGRLAVESGFFPLYHVRRDGPCIISHRTGRTVADYIRHQQACPRPHPDEVSRVQREAEALGRQLSKGFKRNSTGMQRTRGGPKQ